MAAGMFDPAAQSQSLRMIRRFPWLRLKFCAFRPRVMAEHLPEPENLRTRWLKVLERGSREVGQG